MFVQLSIQSTADGDCDSVSDQTRALFFEWRATTLPEHEGTGSSFLDTRIFSHRFFHLRSSWQNQFLQLTSKAWYKCGRMEKIGFRIMKNPFIKIRRFQHHSLSRNAEVPWIYRHNHTHLLIHSFSQSVFERLGCPFHTLHKCYYASLLPKFDQNQGEKANNE